MAEQLPLTFKQTNGELVAPLTLEDDRIWRTVGRHNEVFVARMTDRNDAVTMLRKELLKFVA